MTIAIQNLQTIAPNTDTELLEELNINQLDWVSGGNLILVGVAAGAAAGTAIVAAGAAGVALGYLGAQALSK